MVNLVLVSHSRKLAEATAELARQMVPAQVKILVAAGIGDQRDEFGTDALEILEAIQNAFTSDGVLILMDLGSAVLSAEMACDMLSPEMQGKVVICPAPFVEGTISAGVQTGLGAALDAVYQEAVHSLIPKQEHIHPLEGVSSSTGLISESQKDLPEIGQEQIVVTLINPHGLHARPASKFVQAASQFQANIQVKNLTTGKGPASAKSLNAIAALGVDNLHQIAITASGEQAAAALAFLKDLVESGFGEVESVEAQAAEKIPAVETKRTEDPDALSGAAISNGIASGLLSHFVKPIVKINDSQVDNPSAEWNRLKTTIADVQADIQKHRGVLAKRLGEEFAAILDAHVMMLDDPEMVDTAKDFILNDRKNAEFAWQSSIQSVIQQFEALENDYFKQRAVDVKGLGEQVLFKLAGVSTGLSFTSARSLVVMAEELSPSDTANLNFDQIAALVTLTGGKESHSAILARALDIPLVSNVKPEIWQNPDGSLVFVDGTLGLVWIDPKPETLKRLSL